MRSLRRFPRAALFVELNLAVALGTAKFAASRAVSGFQRFPARSHPLLTISHFRLGGLKLAWRIGSDVTAEPRISLRLSGLRCWIYGLRHLSGLPPLVCRTRST